MLVSCGIDGVERDMGSTHQSFTFLCKCFRVKNGRENNSTSFWFLRFSSFCVIKESHLWIKFWNCVDLIEPLSVAQLLSSQTPLFFHTSSFLTVQLSLYQSLKSIKISCVSLWRILCCRLNFNVQRFFWKNKNFTAHYIWFCLSVFHVTSKWTHLLNVIRVEGVI